MAAIGWWCIAALGAAGLMILWRRRQPVWPLLAHVVAVVGVAAAFYGLWRFRIGAEVAMLLASAVTIDALLSRMSRRAPAKTVASESDRSRSELPALAD